MCNLAVLCYATRCMSSDQSDNSDINGTSGVAKLFNHVMCCGRVTVRVKSPHSFYRPEIICIIRCGCEKAKCPFTRTTSCPIGVA